MGDTSLSTWPQHDSFITETNPVAVKESKDRSIINRVLNHKHMIETIERFEWKNLPKGLNTDLIERILYYRFKGALFMCNDRYLFLPFTLQGEDEKTIDSYGRYISITPVLFTGQWKVTDGEFTKDVAYLSDRSFDVIYDLPEQEEGQEGETESMSVSVDQTKAVILTDSTLEISQDYVPMAYLCRPFNEQLTDILVLVNMDLISSAKVFYVVAKDEDQKGAIEDEFKNLDRRILNGKRVVVVTSPTDLKELVGTSVKDSARYFQSYQSIDNLRKGIIGEDNGGTFMKQEHTTEMESEINSGGDGDPVLNNALRMRKEFCELANATFNLNIEVEIKATQNKSDVAPEGAQTKDRKGDEE